MLVVETHLVVNENMLFATIAGREVAAEIYRDAEELEEIVSHIPDFYRDRVLAIYHYAVTHT